MVYCDGDSKAVGIVTEIDIEKILVKLKSDIGKHFENALRNVTAADIISAHLITTPANTPVSRVVDLMLAKNISIIPVAEGKKVIGLATRKSLVDTL